MYCSFIRIMRDLLESLTDFLTLALGPLPLFPSAEPRIRLRLTITVCHLTAMITLTMLKESGGIRRQTFSHLCFTLTAPKVMGSSEQCGQAHIWHPSASSHFLAGRSAQEYLWFYLGFIKGGTTILFPELSVSWADGTCVEKQTVWHAWSKQSQSDNKKLNHMTNIITLDDTFFPKTKSLCQITTCVQQWKKCRSND